jgi:hypothetical protein
MACDFQPISGQSALKSYFFRTGGVFWDVPDVNLETWRKEVVDELTQLHEIMDKLTTNESKILLLILDKRTDDQNNRILKAISALRAQRNALEAAAAAASAGDQGLIGVVKRLAGIAKNLAAGYAAAMEGQWEVAGPTIYNGLHDLGPMLTNSDQVFPASPDVRDLDRAISDARQGLIAFNDAVFAARTEIVSAQNANLRDLIEVRHRTEQRRTETLFNFADFLRATFQEYFRTAFNADSVLKSNLSLISSYLFSSGDRFIPLDVHLPGDLCANKDTGPIPFDQATGPLGCIGLDRREQQTQVIYSNEGFSKDFPIVVLSCGVGSTPLSIGNLFNRGQVRRVEMNFDPSAWHEDRMSISSGVPCQR